MRSITFGPTSYFESRLQDNYAGEDEGTQINQLSQPERQISQQSQGQSSLRMCEVIFYASENLFRESFVGHRELAMKKYCKCKFACDTTRNFQSYCYEFCGLLNIQMNDIKFYLGNREVPGQRLVRKPCVIEVFNAGSNQNKSGINSLQPAFKELLEKGHYSDIEIIVNGESIKAHKCILIARSEKFKAMIESNMKESIENKVEISNNEISPQTYRYLIQWIYEGECDLPDSIMDLISLLKLTDEYLLPDLQKLCEDQVVEQMDSFSAVEILTSPTLVMPGNSDYAIKEAAKSILLEDYEAVEKQMPDIEERIHKVKGLMSELFIHKKKQKSSSRRRKGSVLVDDGQKKKVRFNISSTIYEEASAIHDESDSLIEPLSIYSNNSPPGELNDEIMVSSTHSSLHVGERRNSSGPSFGTNQFNQDQLGHDQLGSQYIGNDSSGRVHRPASAGRNELHQNGFRNGSNSSIGFDMNNNSESRNQETRIQGRNNSNRSSII